MLDWRQHSLSRRELTGVLALGAVGLSLGSSRAGAIRRLSLVRQETGEATRDVAFWVNGLPNAEGLARLDWLLRDVRAGEVAEIDVRVYELLWIVQREFGGRTIVVTSGYRTEATNRELRRQGCDAAWNSYHLVARAVDLKVDNVPAARVADVGRRLGAGGVGQYPTFVHLDTGPVRYWIG